MDWESHRPSAPSTPTSMSSQSTGITTTRALPYKTVNPSPSVSALTKLHDDDLRRKGVEDLVRILRRVEGDYKYLLTELTGMTKDANRRMQIHLMEIRSLKDINQKLQDDNQELRDLCCFLDDDRQKGRKLAREWQRFGRYTASVMRSEVAAYQEKLRELEQKQEELIKDNTELKELCLYLDQERLQFTGARDEGDGSSNGTTTAHEEHPASHLLHQPMTTNQGIPGHSHRSSNIPEQTMNYIKQLENKVRHLEDEKKLMNQHDRADGEIYKSNSGSALTSRMDTSQPSSRRSAPMGHVTGAAPSLSNSASGASKPEAVVHAMKVLQVHEQLERAQRDIGDENLDDKEKAIVREMCNVVWRKLGDVAPERNHPRLGFPATSSRQGYPLPPPPDVYSPPPPAPSISQGPESLGYQSPPPPLGYNPPSSLSHSSMSQPSSLNGHISSSLLNSHAVTSSGSHHLSGSHSLSHHPSSSSMSHHPSSSSVGSHPSTSSLGHHLSSSSVNQYPSASLMNHLVASSIGQYGSSGGGPAFSSASSSDHQSHLSLHPYSSSSAGTNMAFSSNSIASGHQGMVYTSSSSAGGHMGTAYSLQPPSYRHPPPIPGNQLQSHNSPHTPPPSTPIPMEQPPPPAPRQMPYHQEWRQNFLDGPGDSR